MCECSSRSSFIIYDVLLRYIFSLKSKTILLEIQIFNCKKKLGKAYSTKNNVESEKQINSNL